MKIEITDKEIIVTWFGDTKVCVSDEVSEMIRNAPDCAFDMNRKRIIINLWYSSAFKRVEQPTPKPQRKTSTLDVLEGCARQFGSFVTDFEEDDDFYLGCDPYLPLY